MKHRFDETKLSAYMDGELDADAMHEVEKILEQNESAREYVLDAVRSTARLRGGMNAVLHEAVPGRLLDTIDTPARQKPRRSPMIHQLVRIAAVFILVFTGFAVGTMVDRERPKSLFPLMAPLPADFNWMVSAALEHKLSGTSREWHPPRTPLTVTVIPLKTYRDRNGIYFREYRLEVVAADELRWVNGLAYRITGGQWKTRALFFDTEERSI